MFLNYSASSHLFQMKWNKKLDQAIQLKYEKSYMGEPVVQFEERGTCVMREMLYWQ